MSRTADRRCHYIARAPNARAAFQRLVAQPELTRVAVSVAAFRLTRSPEHPLMTNLDTSNEGLAAPVEQVASGKPVPWCRVDPLLPDPIQRAAC